MQVALIYARLDVRVLKQFPQRIGVVEVQICRGQNASRNISLARSARIAASTCMPLEVTKATENAKLTQSRISDFNVASTLALAVSSLPRMRGEYLSSGSCLEPIKLDSSFRQTDPHYSSCTFPPLPPPYCRSRVTGPIIVVGAMNTPNNLANVAHKPRPTAKSDLPLFTFRPDSCWLL